MDRVLVAIVVMGFMCLWPVVFAPIDALFKIGYIVVFILSLSGAYTIMLRRTAKEHGWERE